MISRSTIDRVRELSTADVVQKAGVELKRKGTGIDARHWGCCPFHNEKSPSFTVKADFYKCFGCGASGDGIGFIMNHKRLDFAEAVKWLADVFGIPVEYDESEDGRKHMAKVQQMTRITSINALALQYWRTHTDPTLPAIAERWPDFKEMMDGDWEVAYGGDHWSALATHLKTSEVDMEQAKATGLVYAKKDGKGWVDAYRGRVIFPIRDHRGRLVAFGGRYMGDHKADETGKYINGSETPVYVKSKVLYGMHIAKHTIHQTQRAYLVEGYTDVIAMHRAGRTNTVAACGTAFTADHVKLLLEMGCAHLVIALDGDKAGREAARKAVLMAVKDNLTCSFLTFPDDHDPDSFLKAYGSLDAVGTDENPVPLVRETDAMESLIDMLWLTASTSSEKAAAEKGTAELLANIGSEIVRKVYADYAKKTYKCASDIYREAARKHGNEVAITVEDDGKIFIPRGVNKEAIIRDGIDMVEEKGNIGIYVMKDKFCINVSNFTIKPLFHIYSADPRNNRRICEIYNGHSRQMIEADSGAFISTTEFQKVMLNQGYFVFEGDKVALAKIVNYVMSRFPRAAEITRLGWQPEGFMAFADAVYEPNGKGLVRSDKNGLVDMGGSYYFLPAYSQLYADIRAGEADPYVEDRFLRYVAGEVTFAQYAQQFFTVFGEEKATWGMCWTIMAAFRDHVYHSLGNFCPHLYVFGETESGKSTFAWSLVDMWFRGRGPFNLGEGSEAGFGAYLENVVNSIAWMDEMSQDTKETFFQMLKGAADGSGRIKRSLGSSRKKNERDQVNSAVLISGQYLVNRDDNALMNRSITLEFRKVKPTPEQRQQFVRLENMRKAGLSRAICEVMDCRKLVEDKFTERYHELNAEMRARLVKKDLSHTNRVIQAFMAVVTVADIVRAKLGLPVTHERMMDMAEERISATADTVADTNALGTFWRILEQQYHHITGKDSEGKTIRSVNPDTDFIIQNHYSGDTISIQRGKGVFDEHRVEDGQPVLYLRLTNIHGIYMREHRAQFNMKGLSEGDLRSYLRGWPGYIGIAKDIYFATEGGRLRTTAMAFYVNSLPEELTLGVERRRQKEDLTVSMPKRANITIEMKPQPQQQVQFPNPHADDSDLSINEDVPF
jgi:DNA primase catalytic core